MKVILIGLYLIAATSFSISFWPNRCGPSESAWVEIPVSVFTGLAWPALLSVRFGMAAHNPQMAMQPFGCERR